MMMNGVDLSSFLKGLFDPCPQQQCRADPHGAELSSAVKLSLQGRTGAPARSKSQLLARTSREDAQVPWSGPGFGEDAAWLRAALQC